ncbi:zf-HC2 domain-containing protein, partial [bacterium]|nr:zf-HC2 domain-containing protein [bacterium]
MNELSCQTALPALHRYVDGECARAERTAVEVHLASCADCRMTLRSLRREADLLSQVASPDEPPADLFERIQARLPSRRAMFFIRHRSALVAAAAVLMLAALGLVAGQWLDGVQPPMAVVYTTGQPQARPTDADPWQPARGEQSLPAGALVRAAGGRSATLEFQDWTQLTLRADATVALLGQRRGAAHWWRLDSGELWAVFGQGRFRVDTAAGSLGGEGCEIAVRVNGRRLARAGAFWPAAYADEPGEIPRATFVVVRGHARAWNGHGSVEVHSGMETRLEPGRAPMAPRPADLAAALAWTQPTTVASA